MKSIKQFGIIPIDFSALASVFDDHKFPKDKISNLEKKGDLIRLKKGSYVVSTKIHNQPISNELIANHLYGPSYVSFESALSFYNLIPERVHTIRSMTIKRSRKFSNSLGNFEYISASKKYYEIGIGQNIINNEYAYLIASPEKALCDIIVATHRLRIQSVKAMQIYLEEDMRMDFSVIEQFNIEIIKQCIATGKKKTELIQLYELLK
jgi:predicted transcriptional regulator of viral defense system